MMMMITTQQSTIITRATRDSRFLSYTLSDFDKALKEDTASGLILIAREDRNGMKEQEREIKNCLRM